MGANNKIMRNLISKQRGDSTTLSKHSANCNSIFGDMTDPDISSFYEEWDAWVAHTLKEGSDDWWKDMEDGACRGDQ